MEAATYEAIVVGAGPGGLATLATLLDVGVRNILWVDTTFGGGRLNELYREISSNTKVGIYLDAIYASPTCRSIIQTTSAPNAITQLESLDRESTCQLSLAGDMIYMLRDGLLQFPEVEKKVSKVEQIFLDEGTWTASMADTKVKAKRVFLCTGSHPKSASLHQPINPELIVLDVDQCMRRSKLPSLLPEDCKSVVGVVGNSHSGILCCWNLYEISKSNQRDVKMFNFRRRPLTYAIYTKDGIVFDNSGLKGKTAEWAKNVMEKDLDRTRLEDINLGKDEDSVYREYLPKCTHIVYAIGYERSSLPEIYINGQRRETEVEFDMHSSGFHYRGGGERVFGLYGNGIAFPQLVKDPGGHIEEAVGVAKFFGFAEKVKESWLYCQ
ncbi:hypothetical protein N7517_003998 [Penicillium concentricum]|uniref:FAD/NAD(P)-binding domain-containing protein n=1 Tax=Penicillium concentricum TaxID=293559 RepID=A0A9W9S4Q1_9EURO|nr:uncharacterized protein N7517_003998 [Penicillium concentricum]KAJ5371992.1 hypothetical protein N7517_003998 [Penicillium concentricum]